MDSTSKTKISLEIIYNQKSFSHSIEKESSLSLLEHLNQLRIPIDQSCGGFGTCGTCMIRVKDNLKNLSPRTECEEEMSLDRGFMPEERLSCQTYVLDQVVIEIP